MTLRPATLSASERATIKWGAATHDDRPHDLPPRWDGRRVEWDEWVDTRMIIVCGRGTKKPDTCGQCGSTRPPFMASGFVYPRDDNDWFAGQQPRAASAPHRMSALTAFRCPDCKHDHVLDNTEDGEQWWDLEPDDYTDAGSDPPPPDTLF